MRETEDRLRQPGCRGKERGSEEEEREAKRYPVRRDCIQGEFLGNTIPDEDRRFGGERTPFLLSLEHFHRDQRTYSDPFPPAVSIYWVRSGGGGG